MHIAKEKEQKRRSKSNMACMNALCRRLKLMFSSSSSSSSSAQTSVAEVKDNETTEQVPLVITVNPFAPIDEVDFVKVEDHEDDNKKIDDRPKDRFKGLKIRRILCSTSSPESSAHVNQNNKDTSSTLSTTSLSTTLELRSACISRYKREFHELNMIGNGEFGSVYRCVNRLDGRVYAIKRSRLLARSNYAQRRAKNEVHANAVLNNHPHVVRYYSAWIEDDRMSIQQEYCNGGDLAAVIKMMTQENRCFEEVDICRILLHVAEGLKYIHGMKLAHMDIKPENIFVSKERIWTPRRQLTCEQSGEFITDCHFEEQVAYKIGDLGHVASIINTVEIEDEGDCRYLCKEVLREDYSDLTKADVFALGLTIYEAGGAGPLPKNGPKWHAIRDNETTRLPRYSDKLNDLIRTMISLDPVDRPSAADIVKTKFLYSNM